MSIDWQPPTLHTARLTLRAVDEDDVEAIFAYAGNPNVSRFTLFETHRTPDDARAFLRDIVAPSYARRVPSPVGIAWSDQPDRLLGTIGCRWATEANKTMELGYALAEEFWGRGIAVEAARALLDFVFAAYDVIRVQAHCMDENRASARVMEKLGMQYEGRLRSAVFRHGRHWDMLMYAVLRCDWAARP